MATTRLFALYLLLRLGSAFPNGAPQIACDDMTPRHNGTEPQDGAPPYALTFVEIERDEGIPCEFNLTISANDESEPFRGFFLQVARESDIIRQPMGRFLEFGEAIPRRCPENNGDNNGVTQPDNSDKTSVTVKWNGCLFADLGDILDARFIGTMVREFGVYWLNVTSDYLPI